MKSHPLRDLGLAVSQLTIIPVRSKWPDDEQPDVASYYVWAGFLVALTAYVPVKLVDLTWPVWHSCPAVFAALVLADWAVVTRMMHWDGLADSADGWFGSTPEARRAIAKDPHVGSFGVVAIILVALVEFAALTAILSSHEHQLLVIPVFARCSATFAAWFGRPAKPEGLAAAVARRPGTAGVVSTAMGAVIVSGLLLFPHRDVRGLVMLVLFWLIAAAVPHLIAKRFGGVTGDVMGASILVVEALLFVIITLVG